MREITWPVVEIYEARVPRAPRDLVLIVGHEPSMRWRALLPAGDRPRRGARRASSSSRSARCWPTSRTRGRSRSPGIASDRSLVDRLDLLPSSYEGPTGIVGVLQAQCGRAGLPAASLWAAVPHYIASAPNPKAALALVRKLEGLVGVTVDASELEQATVDYERQVNLAVQSDPDVQAFVERLERAADEENEPLDPRDLPSGDRIASEFQRFLKQRGEG